MHNDEFEYLSSNFTARILDKITPDLSAIVHACPLSARNPDICLLWHNGYREKHRTRMLIKRLYFFVIALIKLPKRLFFCVNSLGFALYGNLKDTLLVASAPCGCVTDEGRFETRYITKSKDDALFVFGPISQCGKDAKLANSLPVLSKIRFIYSMLKSGMYAFFNIKTNFLDKALLLLEWSDWAISLNWLDMYNLKKELSKTVENHGIKKIGCLHEMHSYARIVWHIADKQGIKSYSIQHASVSRGKRWYFNHPNQILKGLKQPSVIYVFSNDVINILTPYYGSTRFYLGCSARYMHWQKMQSSSTTGKYFLFAGALAVFDNAVLMDCIFNTINRGKDYMPIRVRLHPYSILSKRHKKMLRKYQKRGLLEISQDIPLQEDIKNSAVVIGMSTMVLEEALLCKKPVVQIYHPDYLEYIDINGVKGAVKKRFDDLSYKDLLEAEKNQVDNSQMFDKLGLNNEVVSYKLLFSK